MENTIHTILVKMIIEEVNSLICLMIDILTNKSLNINNNFDMRNYKIISQPKL